MTLPQAFVFVNPAQHNLKEFDCGKPTMNTFLARSAVKHMKLGLSRTWVLPDTDGTQQEKKTPIAAYYTLASATVTREEVPTDKSLPRYPVPVVLLARLAVDNQFKGQRLGEKTLITALRKSVELTDIGLPALGIVLDVLDEESLSFYNHYEIFEPFTDNPMRLFASMHMLRQI